LNFYIVKPSGNYDMNSKVDVSEYVEVGHIHKLECGSLVDENWHHLYTSAYYDHTIREDAPSAVELGVDDLYIKENRIRDGITPVITYSNNQDKTPDREMYLTSIAPYFEESSEEDYVEKLLVQDVHIGKDQTGDINNFQGNVDTLVVSEFVVHGSSDSYSEEPRNIQPKCQVDATSMSIVGKYDDNTQYQINCDENLDIKLYEPTHADIENPTNALEMYKKHIGSAEYLKSIRPDSDGDLDNWRWELKFINPPWFVDRTFDEMIQWEEHEQAQDQ